MPVKNTIIAIGSGIRYELPADAIITPGDLVIQTSTGCTRHNVATSYSEPFFAIENEIFGRGVNLGMGFSNSNYSVDYAVGDNVLIEACYTGMAVNVNIAAGAPAILKGDLMESAGNGTMRKTVTVASAIGRAAEAVDNSASAVATRVCMRIM
jgi:hypothetical protein